VELGRRLGLSEGAVRRRLDLDHRSYIGHVEAALTALGRRLVVAVNAACNWLPTGLPAPHYLAHWLKEKHDDVR